jgi:hypothetical protein
MIDYPTYKVDLGPTPSETLYVCDGCGYAIWAYPQDGRHGGYHCNTCKGRKGGSRPLRLATEAETAEGKRRLQKTIGGRETGGRETQWCGAKRYH